MDSQSQRALIEAEVRRKAARKVGFRMGFYWHLAVFVLVNAGLAGINFNTNPQYLWFMWPLAGWGIALGLHAFGTFTAPDARERMIEAEVQRELVRRGLT